jgi:type II secretory pathway pseudopilin PulG
MHGPGAGEIAHEGACRCHGGATPPLRRTGGAANPGSGFTIAELLVAIAILMFTVTASISGIMFAARSAQLSERRTEALNIANQQIEYARNLSFDDVATVVPSNGLPAGKVPGIQTIGAYTVVIDIAYGTYGASTAARYKTISAVVSWSAPNPGSITISSAIAGVSGTQDYNFGTVTLSIQDESVPAKGVADVIVWLTDSIGHTYSVVTTASGVAQFTYVPSGPVTFAPIKAGCLVDSLSAPICVANTATAYGPVTAHALRTGTVQCLSPSGVPVPGVTVGLSAGPSTVASVLTDASGFAVFPGQVIKGTYTIAVAHALYQLASPATLVVGNTDANMSLTLAVRPSTVTATRSTQGTVYVWNAAGTFNTSKSSSTSRPYTAVFTLTNPDANPKIYYFTISNAFATTTSATVIPGQTYSVTVK